MVPAKRYRLLGFTFDSSFMTLELPGEKRIAIKILIQRFRKLSQCKIRDFAQIIRAIVACYPAINYSRVYAKEFERQKFLALANSNGNYKGYYDAKDQCCRF